MPAPRAKATPPAPHSRLKLHRDTIAAILPPKQTDAFSWICENVVTKRGNPFDPYSYPWTRDICRSWDDPSCEIISFQAGSRLGKTELGLSLLLYSIATDPDVAMIGGPTEDKIKQWLIDRFVPMMQGCMITRDWVPPQHKRKATKLPLRHGIIYGAWSGSPTTLSDLDPKYLFAFESSKFTRAASIEADSFRLLMERGAEIPDRHVYCESTPTVRGKCRIDNMVRSGTDCRYHVPCVHCGTYQELVLGRPEKTPGEISGNDVGGLIWDKESDGHSSPMLAYRTARYRCKSCRQEISEEDRLWMVERGVMVPRGCYADRKGKVRGTAVNAGPHHSFQISRLYGPTFTFGSYAKAFVEAVKSGDQEAIRSFRNNWAGLTWSPHYAMAKWEQIASRICVESVNLRECPEDTQFLTTGIDVQVDHWVFATLGWTAGARGTLVDYGMAYSWDEVMSVLKTSYLHLDNGPRLVPVFTLIDARDGNRTDEIRNFCETANRPSGPWVLPCMGSRANQNMPRGYMRTAVDKQKRKRPRRRGLADFDIITVNTNYYQSWIHNCMDRREPGDENSLTFPISAKDDKDLFKQLLCEQPVWKASPSGGQQCVWLKGNEHDVNDIRDAIRYARCAADVFVSMNWRRVGRTRKYASKNATIYHEPESDPSKTEVPSSQELGQATPTPAVAPKRPRKVRKIENDKHS